MRIATVTGSQLGRCGHKKDILIAGGQAESMIVSTDRSIEVRGSSVGRMMETTGQRTQGKAKSLSQLT